MSAEELERYESEMELELYREYRDLVHLFSYIVHTERRMYLANSYEINERTNDAGDVYFEVTLADAWIWDMYGQSRFIEKARILTFKDVNVEMLSKPDMEVP
jgi:hypothetical protein